MTKDRRIFAPVSVIIPCFRCSLTIERALDSIASQSLLPREVLLVDDASPFPDDTPLELKRLSLKYRDLLNIILVFESANCGPGSARNIGWSMASQPYIAFLDSDDAWHPDKIATQYTWMSENLSVLITGHFGLSFSGDSFNWPGKLAESLVLSTPVLPSEALFSNPFITSSIMLRTTLPLRFKAGKRYAEDFLLWLQLLFNQVPATVIQIPLSASFKSTLSKDGLSSSLWRMELGELDVFRILLAQRLISFPQYAIASIFSLCKFARRIFLSKLSLCVF